jgi:NDP-sugar pyrophosphorylase family protein
MFPVVILAGGLATRLRPITEKIPKALVEINGRPFIDHQLDLLAENGISQVVMSVAYLGEMIADHVGDGSRYGLSVTYSFDGDRYLGTAGAIRQALSGLGPRFFTLYGDSYLTVPFAAVGEAFLESGMDALMTVFRNEGAFDSSNVEFAEGRILVYDKKNKTPRMHHIDYGLGVFGGEVFRHLPAGEPCDLATVYQDVLAAGRLAAFEVTERFYEIGTVSGIADTERFLNERGSI